MTTQQRLAALNAVIAGIYDQAGKNLGQTDALDAADVLHAIRSACEVGLSEFYGEPVCDLSDAPTPGYAVFAGATESGPAPF